MYRLVLYFLIILAAIGLIFSVFGVLPFDPISYIFSFTFIILVSWTVNLTFAEVFEAPANVESFWISALILGLIIPPAKDVAQIIFAGWAAVLAMALKFILAPYKKHIFNPVAISVAITSFAINGTASWWVGNIAFLPLVAFGGFLIVRKIKRWDLVLPYLGVAIATTFTIGLVAGTNPVSYIQRLVIDTPLLFFAAIMITEPITTPPTKMLRIIYGGLVGFLFAPQIHLGPIFTTPELALIVGNVFSYVVSPKYKLILKLKDKIKLTDDIYDFVFTPDRQIKFTPGQYMEWTFEHPRPDDRGNRRYLTIASSPTEWDLRIGVKFADPPSSYKRSLFEMTPDQKIVASQLIGDFTLPADTAQKLVLIAGGVGITPYRSMIKYLIDTNQKRDIVILYSSSRQSDFIYRDVFDEAQNKLGIRTIYVDTETKGRVDAPRLAKEIPDYMTRTFYISGSHSVVTAFQNVLKNLNVQNSQIVTDYFPGFA